jgi:ATP-binding cassette subfamily A (ABC1) protein 3
MLHLEFAKGMLSADSGKCFVGTINVNNHPDEARKLLGLCPQYNILIPELTVGEHLQFFARLKGSTTEEADKEIKTLATEIQLETKVRF